MPLEALDPFVHLDEMGSVDYGPGEPKGTDWHPHRGFETVTYMLDGTFQHQDSHGGGGVIADGATQWMTAGGGILHIETPPEDLVMAGGLFHGLQLWVNLPARDKLTTPRYQSLEGPQVALVSSGDGGALVRVIAGDVGGHPARARPTRRSPSSTPPWLPAPACSCPGGPTSTPCSTCCPAVAGWVRRAVRSRRASWPCSEPATTWRSRAADGASRSEPLEVVVLGGQPLREPVAWYGPFVMNTRDEVLAAMEDFQAGRFGAIPPDGLRPTSQRHH